MCRDPFVVVHMQQKTKDEVNTDNWFYTIHISILLGDYLIISMLPAATPEEFRDNIFGGFHQEITMKSLLK